MRARYTTEMMADMLYESLTELLRIADDVEVYRRRRGQYVRAQHLEGDLPTIGEQRRVNHALLPMARDEFVRL